MELKPLGIHIVVHGSDSDTAEDIEGMTQELFDDLNELNEVVGLEEVPNDTLPEGAKGGSTTIGAIFTKLADVGGVTALINVLGSWLSRNKDRSVELQIGDKSLKVTGITHDEQQDLIHWFRQQASIQLDR